MISRTRTRTPLLCVAPVEHRLLDEPRFSCPTYNITPLPLYINPLHSILYLSLLYLSFFLSCHLCIQPLYFSLAIHHNCSAIPLHLHLPLLAPHTRLAYISFSSLTFGLDHFLRSYPSYSTVSHLYHTAYIPSRRLLSNPQPRCPSHLDSPARPHPNHQERGPTSSPPHPHPNHQLKHPDLSVDYSMSIPHALSMSPFQPDTTPITVSRANHPFMHRTIRKSWKRWQGTEYLITLLLYQKTRGVGDYMNCYRMKT